MSGAARDRLIWTDHARDPAAWARQLGVSVEACQLLLDADFLDLHLDVEVPIRLFGWDVSRHHGVDRRVRPFFGHTDYPRLLEAGFSGVVYDIATNPFRPARNRLAVTAANLAAAQERIGRFEELAVVRNATAYTEARRAGKLAFFLSLQGANALSADPSVLQGPMGELLHRITLVHLTTSNLGGTSSPLGADPGISSAGREMVERCNAARVLVDLAHAGRATFWGALEAHSADIPPIVSHTGVEGVRPHWRNLDDAQIRAIARRGGVVGIMYQSSFLAPVRTTCARSAIVDHLAHVVDLVGEDFAAIGTDYDGMISPPHDLTDVTHHPLLVQDMLDRGWSPDRIRKILGTNYLRVVRAARP
jgi:membrane dipeptidase